MASSTRTPWGWVNLVLGVLVAALLVAALVVWTRPATGSSGDDGARALSLQQRAVTEAASAEVEAFLGVDHTAMTQVVARVQEGATGEFAAEYAAGRDRLVASTERLEAVARPTVRAVALGEVGSRRAEVLVAADARVRNRTSGEEEQLRQHRLRLVMVLRDGRWLTERLEFVS